MCQMRLSSVWPVRCTAGLTVSQTGSSSVLTGPPLPKPEGPLPPGG